MLEKIRTAFRGGYNFVSEKFQNKAVNYYGMDRKSAYPTELVVRPFPIGPPIKCDEWNCKHPLHIASISYYEFRLKPRKLPIFKKTNAGVDDYLSEGAVIVWTAIGQEHCFIRENYFFARSEINWKYCFQAMSGRLFEHYFRHFFVLKETSKGVEKEVAKIYNNSLWGALAQRAVKNKKVFRKVNNISNLHKGKVAYPSQQGGWYVEQTLDKEGDIDRWFESKKARYLPIGVFTTAYQRLEMVRVGQLNYDRLLMMDTDSCFIVGSEADFKVPRSVGGVPD